MVDLKTTLDTWLAETQAERDYTRDKYKATAKLIKGIQDIQRCLDKLEKIEDEYK